MGSLIGGCEPDLIVESHQAFLAEPQVAVEVARLRDNLAQQQSRHFFPALQIDRGDVLVAPRDEADAGFDRREAEIDGRVDAAYYVTGARHGDESAFARVLAGDDRH